MSVALASTWQPRGEMPRFQRLHSALRAHFETMILVMPPDENEMAAIANQMPGVHALPSPEWRNGRVASLVHALEGEATHILYSDFDRLLHWIEVFPDELRQTLERIERTECLVIGRTARAFETHPRSLRETEAIINDIYAHVSGNAFDICVAARGLSRNAAKRLVADSQVGTSMGVDGEWLMLLQRAGVPIDYVTVEGMEWETADQFLPHAADAETRQKLADDYDASSKNWAQRVYVAQQIIDALLNAAKG